MLNNFFYGFLGGLAAIIIYQAYMNYKYKKTVKELDSQIDKLFKSGPSKEPQFKKGDFLKTKEKELQEWETEQPPAVYAEVMEVGKGEYLLNLTIPGHGSMQQGLPFTEAHAAFIKDVTKKQKPVFKLVKEENA